MACRRLMLMALIALLAAESIGAEVELRPQTQFGNARNQVIIDHAGGMPALCRAGNGDLLFAHAEMWEPVPSNGAIRLLRSGDEGRTWSEPRVIVRPKSADWTATTWSGLHLMPDGSLILTYNQSWAPKRSSVAIDEVNPAKIWDIMSPQRKFESYIIRSVDHGHTWSEPQRICPELNIWLFGRPLTLRDGTVIAPTVPFNNRDISFAAFVRSADSGRTWGRLETIADGPEGFNEVTLGLAKNGNIIAILRDIASGPRRQFRQTVSKDEGKTWTKPRLIEVWGKMPDLLTLSDGRLVLAVGSLDCMDGDLAFSGPRNSSYAGLFVSSDHGRTWQRDLLLGSPDPRNTIPYDAPVMAPLKNGNLLAISFAADRRYQRDPLFGWSRGMHYVLHELRPTEK